MTLWFTITQLAQATGYSRTTIRRWKLPHDNGTPRRIALDTLPQELRELVIAYYESDTGCPYSDTLNPDLDPDLDPGLDLDPEQALDQPGDIDIPLIELRQLSTEAVLLQGIAQATVEATYGGLISPEEMRQAERLARILALIRQEA